VLRVVEFESHRSDQPLPSPPGPKSPAADEGGEYEQPPIPNLEPWQWPEEQLAQAGSTAFRAGRAAAAGPKWPGGAPFARSLCRFDSDHEGQAICATAVR